MFRLSHSGASDTLNDGCVCPIGSRLRRTGPENFLLVQSSLNSPIADGPCTVASGPAPVVARMRLTASGALAAVLACTVVMLPTVPGAAQELLTPDSSVIQETIDVLNDPEARDDLVRKLEALLVVQRQTAQEPTASGAGSGFLDARMAAFATASDPVSQPG